MLFCANISEPPAGICPLLKSQAMISLFSAALEALVPRGLLTPGCQFFVTTYLPRIASTTLQEIGFRSQCAACATAGPCLQTARAVPGPLLATGWLPGTLYREATRPSLEYHSGHVVLGPRPLPPRAVSASPLFLPFPF